MRRDGLFVLLVLSLLGCGAVLWTTSRWGVNLNDDAVFYLRLAKGYLNFHDNQDMIKTLLLRFAPFYSAVVSMGRWIGLDILEWARLLNAGLFGLNFILAWLVIRSYTGNSRIALAGPFIVCFAPDVFEVHCMAMTEPLFISFLFLWMIFLMRYLKKPELSWLVLAAVCAGFSSVTRYAGMLLIAASYLGILCLNKRTFPNKLLHSFIFILIGCIPQCIFWLLFKDLLVQRTARELVYHPALLAHGQDFLMIVNSWFFPVTFSIRTMVLVCSGLVLWFLREAFRVKSRKLTGFVAKDTEGAQTRFSAFLSMYIVIYLLSFFFTALFLDAKLAFEGRYFIPVHISGLILLVGFLLEKLLKHGSSEWKIRAGMAVLGYLFVYYGLGSAHYAVRQYTAGDMYSASPVRSSTVVRKLKELPLGTPIYSNDNLSVFVFTAKESRPIPSLRDGLNDRGNDNFETQFAQMQEDLRYQKAVLVYFSEDYTESGSVRIEKVLMRVPLRLITRDPFGAIYAL